MKRIIAILCALLMLSAFTACAPDNILTESVEPNPPEAPPFTEEKQPDVILPEETLPESMTITEADQTTGSIITPNKRRNDRIRPSFDIDSAEFTGLATTLVKDRELSFYTTDFSAFKAGALDEKQWLDALDKEYGLSLKYTKRTKGTLYSAQAIAVKTGIKLDLITAPVNDLIASCSLMQSAEGFVTSAENLPFSASVFAKTKNRLFTANGVSRVLWYNKTMLGEMPYTRFDGGTWTTQAFSALYQTVTGKQSALLECNNWAAFGSVGAVTATGLTDNGFELNLTDKSVIDAYEEFGRVVAKSGAMSNDDYTFAKGNTAFYYSDTPGTHEFELSWVPLPKNGQDGRYVAEYTGVGMGVSKYAAPENVAAAVTLALLWSARYSEARVDSLLFDSKLSYDQAEKYFEFSEQFGGLYSSDAVATALLDTDVFPIELYGSEETITTHFADAYARQTLINARYR